MKKGFQIMLLLASVNASARLNLDVPRGENTSVIKSPRGLSEVCIITQKIPGANFSEEDLKNEQKLCAIDFYEDSVVCAKQNSTNPGLLLGKLPSGKTKENAEKALCNDLDDLKKVAKFKQSISCSYTPAMLAYYQFSRFFDAGRVPVSVLRTMDKTEHEHQTDLALSYDLSGIIKTNLKSMQKAHDGGTDPALFDDSKKFIYGALNKNVSNGNYYGEVNGKGEYETRYQRFLKLAPFQRVSSDASVEALAQGSSFNEVVQTVVQMKDVSDMVLLDTILSQDDRIGNIHYKFAWYYVDEKGMIQRHNSDTKIDKKKKVVVVPVAEKAKYKALNAVLVKEMILKDNECGVDVNKRTNMMRNFSAIEQLKHMSAKTYSKLMKLNSMAKTLEFNAWMQRELLYTKADLAGEKRSFQNNLSRAVTVLRQNCENGSLQLDLNLEDYVPGATKTKINCDGKIL